MQVTHFHTGDGKAVAEVKRIEHCLRLTPNLSGKAILNFLQTFHWIYYLLINYDFIFHSCKVFNRSYLTLT